MPAPISCRIVTPREELLNEEVVYANVPAHDGLIGFQHGSAPLVARLGLGKLTLQFSEDAGGGTRIYFVDGGFLKMSRDELVILAERAQAAETIIASEAQAELAEAQARVIPDDEPDRFAAAERLRREQESARLRVTLATEATAAGI